MALSDVINPKCQKYITANKIKTWYQGHHQLSHHQLIFIRRNKITQRDWKRHYGGKPLTNLIPLKAEKLPCTAFQAFEGILKSSFLHIDVFKKIALVNRSKWLDLIQKCKKYAL